MFVSLIFCIVCLFVAFHYKWKRKRIVYYMNKCNGPPTFPLLGNALDCLCTSKVLLKKAYYFGRIYESPIRAWLFHLPYMAISTPEDIQMITSKCLEKDAAFDFLGELIGDGVLTAKVAKWKRSRRIMSSAFNMSIMSKSFLEVFNRQTHTLMQQIAVEVEAQTYFDLWPYVFKSAFSNIIGSVPCVPNMVHAGFAKIALRTIFETAMGHTKGVNEDDFTKMRKAYEISSSLVCKRLYQPWLRPPIIFKLYLFLMGMRNVLNDFKMLPLKILELRRKMFAEQRELAKKEEKSDEKNIADKSYKSMIDLLLNEGEVDDRFTDQEIADEVTTILFAGSETNAITISFTLFMLAIRQDIQEKVYNELTEIFGDDNRFPTIDDLNRVQYLEQCIKETLRYLSVAPLSSRVSNEDITLSTGHVVPAGVRMIAAYMLVHRDGKYYSNPSRWHPAHFDPEEVANRPSGAFVPFGYGPRICMGYKYGLLAIKAQLSTLLRNYKLTTDFREEDIQLNVDILIRSATPYRVKAAYRHEKSLFPF